MKKNTFLIFAFLCAVLAKSQEVTTFAGSVPGNFNGIGTAAKLHYPFGICVDQTGDNLYVAETEYNTIKKININTAQVSSIAGSSTIFDTFQDGTGSDAFFSHPMDLCELNGYLYVADCNSYRIRKIELATGIVTTLAGGTFGTADGVGTDAQFENPHGICFDNNNNLYVTEYTSNRIRKINISTGLVSTLVGNDQGYSDGNGTDAQFFRPRGICYDKNGHLYVADSFNNKIRKIDITSGDVTTVNFPPFYFDGSYQTLFQPIGICIDRQGNLFITQANHQIIRFEMSSGQSSIYVGSSWGFLDAVGTDAKFFVPYGICSASNGNLYVGDSNNHRVRKISTSLLSLDQNIKVISPFSIYPNPSNDIIHIENPNLEPLNKITIIDMCGKAILTDKETTLSVANLKSGLYIVAIQSDKTTYYLKLIKK